MSEFFLRVRDCCGVFEYTSWVRLDDESKVNLRRYRDAILVSDPYVRAVKKFRAKIVGIFSG